MCVNTHMWNLEKMVQMSIFTEQEQRGRHRKWTCGLGEGEGEGWVELREQH